MNKKQMVSLIGLLISILVFVASFISIGIIGEVNTATLIIIPLFLLSIPAGLVFTILLIIFSVTKDKNPKPKKEQPYIPPQPQKIQSYTPPQPQPSVENKNRKNEERTFKEGLKRTPWYIWVITIFFTLIGLVLLIIPPIGLMSIALGFAAFWLPYYTWKNEHIRAPWPSGKLTHEKIVQDFLTHKNRKSIMLPDDYRIVEDIVLKTEFSLGDDYYTPTTITFEKNGTYRIKPPMFQKYYSSLEIAINIKEGEGVYLIFSNKTNELEFVYRKIYCTL